MRGDSQTGCPSPSTISRACCESPPAGVRNTSPGAASSRVVVTVSFGGVRSGRLTKCRRSSLGLFFDDGFGAGGGWSGNGDGVGDGERVRPAGRAPHGERCGHRHLSRRARTAGRGRRSCPDRPGAAGSDRRASHSTLPVTCDGLQRGGTGAAEGDRRGRRGGRRAGRRGTRSPRRWRRTPPAAVRGSAAGLVVPLGNVVVAVGDAALRNGRQGPEQHDTSTATTTATGHRGPSNPRGRSRCTRASMVRRPPPRNRLAHRSFTGGSSIGGSRSSRCASRCTRSRAWCRATRSSEGGRFSAAARREARTGTVVAER